MFQQIDGVKNVRQGYVKSVAPNDTWSEAILIDYDSEAVDLVYLIDIHLETHASTVGHQRRTEYRSAIYNFHPDQIKPIEAVMSSLSRKRKKSYITQILEFAEFKESRESIRNYYKTRPEAPFCRRYIEPKLEIVRGMKT